MVEAEEAEQRVEEERKRWEEEERQRVEEEKWKAEEERRRAEEIAEEEQRQVEKHLGQIEELLEGLGLQIAAFQEALSILAGKIPDKDLYGDRKKGKEKEEIGRAHV